MIGDVVFTTPAIRALRRHFPQAHLTYLVEEQAAPVVAGNPHLDDVIVIPHSPAFLQTVLAVVPLQLLAYRIARLRGLNVDQPRNLAKTVTVE